MHSVLKRHGYTAEALEKFGELFKSPRTLSSIPDNNFTYDPRILVSCKHYKCLH